MIDRDGNINAYSPGSLSLNIIGQTKNVDYLVLYNLEKQGVLIVRGKEAMVQGNMFVFPEDKIIACREQH